MVSSHERQKESLGLQAGVLVCNTVSLVTQVPLSSEFVAVIDGGRT